MIKTNIIITFIIILSINKALMFNDWWEKSNLVTLDSDNFNDEISQDQYTIVEFYTKWCKYCKQLAPILDNLVHEVKKIENDNLKIKVARLESEANQSIAFMYGVYSFPQVFLFHKGKAISSFDDHRELNFFVFWLKKSLPYMKRKGKVIENEKLHMRRKVNDHKENRENDMMEKTISKAEDPVLKKEDISILNTQLNDIKGKITLLEYEMNSLLNDDKITSEKMVKYIIGSFFIALIVVVLVVCTQISKRKKQD